MGIGAWAALAGIVAGTAIRYYLLRVDYRNYPSYPHGYLTHLALGAIAAFMGAVSLPALLDREYTAVTFLALAATQFREVRKFVRDGLERVEANELVRRGADYIEGIARTFEARNYLVMLTAVLTSGGFLLGGWPATFVGALLGAVVSARAMHGQTLADIADIKWAQPVFSGPDLWVDGVFIMNVGLAERRAELLKYGAGLVIVPRTTAARDILSSPGQRQAILHDLVAKAGTKKDISNPEYTPLARKALDDGRIALFIVPQTNDPQLLITAAQRVPVLEGVAAGQRGKG